MKLVYNEKTNSLSLGDIPEDYTVDIPPLDLYATKQELMKIPKEKLSEHFVQMFCHGLWPQYEINDITTIRDDTSVLGSLARGWIFNPDNIPYTNDTWEARTISLGKTDAGWVVLVDISGMSFPPRSELTRTARIFCGTLEEYVETFFMFNAQNVSKEQPGSPLRY